MQEKASGSAARIHGNADDGRKAVEPRQGLALGREFQQRVASRNPSPLLHPVEGQGTTPRHVGPMLMQNSVGRQHRQISFPQHPAVAARAIDGQSHSRGKRQLHVENGTRAIQPRQAMTRTAQQPHVLLDTHRQCLRGR